MGAFNRFGSCVLYIILYRIYIFSVYHIAINCRYSGEVEARRDPTRPLIVELLPLEEKRTGFQPVHPRPHKSKEVFAAAPSQEHAEVRGDSECLDND